MKKVFEADEASKRKDPMAGAIRVFPPDVDGAYRRALAAGVKSLAEPADKNGVKDAFGNVWYIATLNV